MGIRKAQSEIFDLSQENKARKESGREDSIWDVKKLVAEDIVDMLEREVDKISSIVTGEESRLRREIRIDELDRKSISRLREGFDLYKWYCKTMKDREKAMLHAHDELQTEKSSSERKKTYRVAIKNVKEASKTFNAHKKTKTKINKYAQEEARILDLAVEGIFENAKSKTQEQSLYSKFSCLPRKNSSDLIHIKHLVEKQISIDSRVNASKNKFAHNFPSVPTL